MKISIADIKVTERIRKRALKIEKLSEDIKKNGLINPITVMAIEGSEKYQLLAGLRRLRSVGLLGWAEVEANVVRPKDAEAALKIEYSENVQRMAFTFSEKMDYARLIEEIERAKAEVRKLTGKAIKDTDLPLVRAEGRQKRETRTIVGEKIGVSGQQYDRAKYVAAHASQEVIDELDRGERSIYGTYMEMRRGMKCEDEKDLTVEIGFIPEDLLTAPRFEPYKPRPHDEPANDYERANYAECEVRELKEWQHNQIFHRDTIIENLGLRLHNLQEATTPKTNFDVWKDSLTPELIAEQLSCSACPAYGKTCEKKDPTCCRDSFLAWANGKDELTESWCDA